MIALETLLLFIGLALFLFYGVFAVYIEKIPFKWKGNYPLFAYIALGSLGIWVIVRTLSVWHAPFSGAYESMVFFGTLYALKIFILTRFADKIKAVLLSPTVLLLSVAFLLPDSLKEPLPYPAALQSYWIFIHVPSFFMGYVSLSLAFVLSLFVKIGIITDMQNKIDKEIRLALVFLTAGIVTGGVWASLAWGRFWSWDPKEIWALITWMVLMQTLHSPQKKYGFWLLALAFGCMIFTYVGVMFLIPGLHSYR